jgi:hypothetical protein
VIDVEFGAGVLDPDVRVAAYAKISSTMPFESAAVMGSASASALTTATQIGAPPTLLVATTCVANNNKTIAIDGFVTRGITQPNGDALADTVSRDIGAATATARQSAMSSLIVQLAAFQGVPAR